MPPRHMIMKLGALALILCCAFWSSDVRAGGTVYISAPAGLAIGGYDPVSYYTPNGPRPGSENHAIVWKGAVWLFMSPDNLARFEANPRAYVPRFGGHCAYGMSKGGATHGDPLAFTIMNEQLYLFHNAQVQALWLQEHLALIDAAEAFWPHVLRQ